MNLKNKKVFFKNYKRELDAERYFFRRRICFNLVVEALRELGIVLRDKNKEVNIIIKDDYQSELSLPENEEAKKILLEFVRNTSIINFKT